MTSKTLALPLLFSLFVSAGCAAEEDYADDPFNSDVTPTGDEKADEAAALTGFIVLGENDSLPAGKVAIYGEDGFQVGEIDIDDYLTRANAGEASLFASPAFVPADGRDIVSGDDDREQPSSFAPNDIGKDLGGSDDASPTAELNPFHCNASGELRPNPLLPPCEASGRWVTPRVFSGPARDYAYLLYRYEHMHGDADDEYPYGERSWWGWGGTVELHTASLLWSRDNGSFNRTEVSVPEGSRFEYSEARLVKSQPFKKDGHTLTAVFLRLPLVFTNE